MLYCRFTCLPVNIDFTVALINNHCRTLSSQRPKEDSKLEVEMQPSIEDEPSKLVVPTWKFAFMELDAAKKMVEEAVEDAHEREEALMELEEAAVFARKMRQKYEILTPNESEVTLPAGKLSLLQLEPNEIILVRSGEKRICHERKDSNEATEERLRRLKIVKVRDEDDLFEGSHLSADVTNERELSAREKRIIWASRAFSGGDNSQPNVSLALEEEP